MSQVGAQGAILPSVLEVALRELEEALANARSPFSSPSLPSHPSTLPYSFLINSALRAYRGRVESVLRSIPVKGHSALRQRRRGGGGGHDDDDDVGGKRDTLVILRAGRRVLWNRWVGQVLEDHHMPLEELAARAGVPVDHLSDWVDAAGAGDALDSDESGSDAGGGGGAVVAAAASADGGRPTTAAEVAAGVATEGGEVGARRTAATRRLHLFLTSDVACDRCKSRLCRWAQRTHARTHAHARAHTFSGV
jgi:hypothetical protein